MPILFGPRRQSTPAPPLTWETAAPDAANAAASAFRRREANLSLSSSAAAAAAALRARPMPSTNVSTVQSKRAPAHRRSPSVSSLIGRDRLARRDLHRSPSVCSMVERSFRSPSPGGQGPTPLASDAPPVPKLPKVDVTPAKKSTKVADGTPPLQTQHFRTASQRVKDGRLGSWFGGAITRDGSNTRKRSSSVTISGSGTFDGRSSGLSLNSRPESVVRARSVLANTARPKAVNDRPVNDKPVSDKPVSDKPVSDKPLNDKPVREVTSRRLLPRRQLLGRSQSVRETAEQPKRAKQDLSRAGSHLSRGTTDRTQAPTLQSLRSPPAQQESPAVPPVPQSTEPTDLTKKKKKKKKKAASKTKPAEAPSETPVAMEEQTAPGDSQISFGEPTPPLSDKPPVLELAFQFSGDETSQPEMKEPDEVTTDGAIKGRAKSPPAGKRQGRARAAREPSESPARSARFASTTTQPLVMHEPPPRSVSPMKSALKHLHPKDSHALDESDVSDREPSADRHEDAAAVTSKKSARVSWDDHTLVVGEPDSVDDKETEKPWFGDAKEQQKSLDEDETMSPRPALPLFGSVRDKKCRDLEERPLVRPAERTRSQPASDTNSAAEGLDPTSTAEAQDQVSRSTANSPKYREPSTAATSSADGGVVAKHDENDAQVSDDDLESDAETERGLASDPTPSGLTLQKSSPPAAADDRRDDSLSTASTGSDAGHVGAEADEDDEFVDSDDQASNEEDSRLVAARSGEASLGANNPLMEDIQEEEDETDRCSVYSDACEVLSPIESLDDGLHSSAGAVDNMGSSTNRQASPRSPNDWENAKSYWKSLTPGQRRQLEVEALEEDPDFGHSPPGSSKRSTTSTKETGSERSYQIKPGTRWEEQPPPVPPKPGMVRQVPTAAAAAAVQPKVVAPMQTPPEIPQPNSIELPRTAVRPRSNEPSGLGLGSPRTVRIGSFEAVWEPKYLEGGQYGPFAKFIKGGKSSSETRLPPATQSASPPASSTERPRNRSVDETASQAMTTERRGSEDSVSSFRRSCVMPLAVNNSPGIRSWMNDQQQQQQQSQEPEETASSSPRSPSQPTYHGHGSAPTTTTTTTTATTTAMSSPAVSSGGDGGYLRQSLRGQTVPAPPPIPAVAASSPALVSPGRRRSASRKARKARNDSRLVDSSDEEDGGGSSHFHSRFDDSSDEDDDVSSGRRPRPRAKGMARTMRGEANSNNSNNNNTRSSSAVSPPTGPSSDPGSPAPAWNREALPPPPSRNRFSSRGTSSRRRGSFMSMLFRKMREGGSSSSSNHHHYYSSNSKHTNNAAHSPLAERRSGSSGGSARQVLSAARQVLSSSDRPRPSTASAPSRTRQLLVRRQASRNNFDGGSDGGGSGGRQPRRKFAALRRMLGFYD
ncbi:hypothetical protein CP533_2951 [Ophiocordyceps camponoti-saundersi (nom. inval.)]|nr:hypothetical protein CP533_2951 [Ophiocordyceps camponoti-saundersi (nom. inval.)]